MFQVKTVNMEKQTKLYLGIGAAALAAYWLWKNSKKITTASPAADKMKMTCAEGEKLIEEPTGLRCVPVAGVVSGPMPSVDLGGATASFDAKSRISANGMIETNFSNPNISGVPTVLVCPRCGKTPCCCGRGPAWANYVDVKANSFFQPKQGGFYK
jgi:hypothetical protein